MKKITLLLIGMGMSFAGFTQVPLYEQNFELGLGGWVIDNTNNGSWALGTPAAPIINSAASGSNAIVTNLTGNYIANDNSTVTSPLINIAAASGKEQLIMNVWWSSEFSWDGANVFGSYDGGTTWNIIGTNGGTTNWYNDNTINGAPNGSQIGWTGDGINGSGGWVTAVQDLDSAMLVNNNSLILRVGFGSDGSVLREGFAFDDVKISAPIRVDLSASAISLPVQCSYGALEPITITICNIGDTVYNAGTVIPVSYTHNGGTPVNENFLLTTALLQDSCVDYTFNALSNLSASGSHDIIAWTAYGTDYQNDNDTISTSVYNSTATVPYYEDFETGQNGWVIDNTTNGSWEYGTPANTIINSAASGSNAIATNLTGLYNASEDSKVTSPCIDISNASGFDIFSMKVWWSSENSWDGANLFSSYDGGITWNQIGNDGDPYNWYNDNTINGAPNSSQEGWTGDGFNGSPGWVVVQHALDTAMMQSSNSLLLRVGFGSDGSVMREGFAFDDIAIGVNTATYEYGVAGIDSVSTCDPAYTLDAGAGHPFYHWADVNNHNYSGTWSNTQTVDVTQTGTYVITVTDTFGMMATDTVFVEIKDFQPPMLTDVVSCVAGDSAQFDAGSGTTPANILYNWSTGDATQTSWLYAMGTISVTKTDTALGCFASDTAIFTDKPIFTIGNDTTICEGSQLILDPGTALFYLWSDGTSNPTLAADTAGTYFVEITSSAGCLGSDTMVLSTNPLPVLDLGIDDLFCDSITLDAGTIAGASYLWHDGSSNQTFTATQTDSIYVSITDANGCSASDSIYVIINPDACVGLDELTTDTEALLYPNPTQGGLTIQLSQLNTDVVMSISTIYGQIIRSERITSTTTTLDLNNLAEGTYILQLQSENSTSINKFIINR